MTCPHAAIVSGGAKAAADLCKGSGLLLARQAHGKLSSGGVGWQHAAIASGWAKAAADLCKGSGLRRARQAHEQLSSGGVGWRGPTGHCLRAAVQAVPGRDQTGQRRNISLALDTAGTPCFRRWLGSKLVE